MNEFSKQTISVIKNIYKKYIVEEYNITVIAVGGSVARGYGCQSSDVDLLFFCQNISQYKKKFCKEKNINIELHYIPLDVLSYHCKILEPILTLPIIRGECEISPSILGEKRCENYNYNDDLLTKMLSSWREVKKMTDIIILYENNPCFHKFIRSFNKVNINQDKILSLALQLISNENTVETVIKLFKLSAIYNNDVFSKVFWTDHFLADKPNVKKQFENILDPLMPLPKDWIESAKSTLILATEKHPSITCKTCEGDIRRCNLGRCFFDYLNDTERAINEGYFFGSWLSLKKSIDYAKKLSLVSGFQVDMPKRYYEYWDSRNRLSSKSLTELFESLFF